MTEYEDPVEQRFRTLMIRFRINHTMELDGGRCACVTCKKLFRTMEYLNMHFERKHAIELQELRKRAQHEQTIDDYIPVTHHTTSKQINSEAQLNSNSSVDRAIAQAYNDLEERDKQK